MKSLLKILLIVFATCVLIAGAFLCWFIYITGGFQQDYTPKELADNFYKKEHEIYRLKHYFKTIVPQNKAVEIEFDGNNKLSRFGITPLDNSAGDLYGPHFLEWDLPINTASMDSILATIHWSRQTLRNLKEKLDDANCISIAGDEPSIIGFKRSGMGMYFFDVFDYPVTDSLRGLYNDSCSHIVVSDQLILEYWGGAIGPQCFPRR